MVRYQLLVLVFSVVFWAHAQEDISISINQQEDTIQKAPTNKALFQDLIATAQSDSIWLASVKELTALGEFAGSIEKTERFPKDSIMKRLDALDKKTIFDVAYHPSLESVIGVFLRDKRELMQRVLERSQYYFPLFEEALDAADMPLEIKYLAIVESALNPKAKSRVGATGLWQFMYATGKMHNLSVSNYVDDRQDPIKSTKAAVAYLKQLYGIFGDWNLALAAYNSGPGNVNKAIRRSGGKKNFWAIRPFLPKETAGYVPAFMASMFIFEYADELGFERKTIETPLFATDTIQVKSWITFDQISKMVNVDKELIDNLNPSYKLGVVPYAPGKNFSVRLPVEAIGRFVANEEAIYQEVAAEAKANEKKSPMLIEAEAPTRYTVRSGDYLGKIAERYGVGVSLIKKWNNLKSNNIYVGQRLIIYPKSFPTSSTSSASGTPKTYTVKSGESLWTIAQKFPGINFEDIKKWNAHLGSNILPGTKVYLCDCK